MFLFQLQQVIIIIKIKNSKNSIANFNDRYKTSELPEFNCYKLTVIFCKILTTTQTCSHLIPSET